MIQREGGLIHEFGTVNQRRKGDDDMVSMKVEPKTGMKPMKAQEMRGKVL